MKEKKCRCKKCGKFRKTHDFEYLDIFGLYGNLSEYIYPRLVAFKKHTFSYPFNLTNGQWNKVLDKMIYAFKKITEDNRNPKDYKRIKEGLKLFSEYFENLWI